MMAFGSRGGPVFPRGRGWVAGLLVAVLLATMAPRAWALRQGDPLASACGVSARLSADPSLVPRGEAVNVQDELLFSCPQHRRPFHLALVAWHDESPTASWVPGALTALGADLNVSTHPWLAVGVTVYADTAVSLCRLEREPERLDLCLSRLGRATPTGQGGAGLASAVHEGWKALAMARADSRLAQADEPLRESMLVVVPPAAAQCGAAQRELAAVRQDNVDVSLVCAADGCEDHCLLGSVPPDRFYPATAWDSVAHRMIGLARASELKVIDVTLRESLAPAAQLVPGSADPRPWLHDPATGALAWQFFVQAQDALRVSYGVRPSGSGLGTVSLVDGGFVVFTDSHGRSGSLVLPPRRAVVGWPVLLPAALREDRVLHP